MDDRDLEARLSARLHSRFDRPEVPPMLSRDVVDARTRTRSSGRGPGPFSFLAAAAVIAIVAVAAGAWLGPRLSDVGAAPTATPSPTPTPTAVATASPSPTPTVAPTPTVLGPVACGPTDLTATDSLVEGAAGSRFTTVSISTTDPEGCLLPGTPAFQLVDAKQTVLVASTAAGPDVTIQPGTTWSTDVRFGNWCGSAMNEPVTLQLLVDGGFVAVTGPSLATSDGPPPCNGTGGPQLDATVLAMR
jgi:hypothetical protein